MLRLKRIWPSPWGTLGVMFAGFIPFAMTLEPVNSIPAGTYPLRIAVSPKRGYPVYWIDKVPGFSDVQIHKGNTYKDTEGCILIGNGIDNFSGNILGIIKSAEKFAQLMAMKPHDQIKIS